MGTTIYASSTKAVPCGATNPARTAAGWTACGTGIVFRGGDDTGDGSSLTSVSGGSHSSSTGSYRIGVWIYGPVAPQTLSGTVAATIRARSGTFTNIAYPAFAAYIMKPCGAKRANIVSGVKFCTFCCLSTSFADYGLGGGWTIAACATAQNGDYIVLEAGSKHHCFICSNTEFINTGSSGLHMRWVFSGTILLAAGGIPSQLLLMGVGT